MFAISFDGWTTNPVPLLFCMVGLIVNIFWTKDRLHYLSKKRKNFCDADLGEGVIYLAMWASLVILLVFLPWHKSFNPPVWLKLIMAAPPLVMGSWNFLGSIRGTDMRIRTFRLWYRVMYLHLLVVLALPVIYP